MKLLGTADAAGKINLRLKVTARRPDGYHELDTVFYPLEFPADKVGLFDKGTPGITFHCATFASDDPEKNLVVRAARAYAERAEIEPRWHISLDKILPVAAGVGGGSSDAAAVLSLLNQLYGKLNKIQLAEIAVALGADVPFFLERRPMRATGIGEKLTDFIIPGKMPEVMLVFPGFPVSAKWGYSALDPSIIGPDDGADENDFAQAFAHPGNADWEYLTRNDLAFALWEKFPLCRILKNFMLEHGAWCAQISGSGSSLFALFPDRSRAMECAGKLRRSEFGSASCTRIFTGGKEL